MLVLEKGFENHIQNLRNALVRFWHYVLKLKHKKCSVCQQKVQYQGRVIKPNSLEIGEQYVQVVKD